MKKPANISHSTTCLYFVLLAVLLLPACESDEHPDLQLDDLNQDEQLYVTRLVTLERAKAVALVDRATGDALLDSLATAWGDSARTETQSGLPGNPVRSGKIGKLLIRILEAELDSLIWAPRPDRLTAPLPNPALIEPPLEEESGQ